MNIIADLTIVYNVQTRFKPQLGQTKDYDIGI